jgi:hypothetical protein
MRGSLMAFLLCCGSYCLQAQPMVTRSGYIGFFSKTPLEDIKAENQQVNAVLDPEKKNLAFALLVKGFLFTKALMQQHFNENYIESDKYPKANFSGSYSGEVDLTRNGSYPVMVKGNLTLHGVTKNIEVPAVLEVKDGKLAGKSNFQLKPEDFNIKIPALVKDKIAKQIDVAVKVEYNISK